LLLASDTSFKCLREVLHAEANCHQLHVAIFNEPYLSYILEGKKTVESRFSLVRCAPYEKVFSGDIILLKEAGGPVSGVCRVDAAWFYKIDRKTLGEIRQRFAERICPADPRFWSDREGALFGTLISLSDVKRVPGFQIGKRDRRGWVTIG
jgi:hypothetical protein